jgi:hypothetical protein
MNTKSDKFRALLACSFLAMLSWTFPSSASGQSDEKFYYWMIANFPGQSFVVEVNAAIKAEIDELLARGHEVGVRGRIAAGSVPYNKNYYGAGQPIWNWHFVSVDSLRDFTEFPIDTTEVNPNRDSAPSDIAADPTEWIRLYGDAYYPRRFFVLREIDPSQKDAMANLSNRGITGAGEKTLIAGITITGGEPRNVVVRALGPSLTAAGIQQAAANPKIEIYNASGRRIGSNADWRTDRRANVLVDSYPSLAPSDDKEAAMFVTLLPGAYTLQGTNEDGTEGIVLLEAYDVDSALP